MTNILNIMKVELTVLSISKKEKHSCNVRIAIEINGKMETSILKECFISGLAKHRFLDPENSKFILKQKYSSQNNSKDYNACPILLKRTCSQKNGKEMYTIQVVNEGMPIKHNLTTPKGKEIIAYTFTTVNHNKWLRYSDYYNRNFKKYKEQLEEKQTA